MPTIVDTYFDGKKTTYVIVDGDDILYLLKHNDDVIAFSSLEDYMNYDGVDDSKGSWLENYESSDIETHFRTVHNHLIKKNDSGFRKIYSRLL